MQIAADNKILSMATHMKTIFRKTQATQYRYDPLNRLFGYASPHTGYKQLFYQLKRITTEIGEYKRTRIFQHSDTLLAIQHYKENAYNTQLLKTDASRSIIGYYEDKTNPSCAYTPYGHPLINAENFAALAFNGEYPIPDTGHYLLGNGYRAFNPILMRFNSPDSSSPFSKGGINTYGYCTGNPINFSDSSGHVKKLIKNQLSNFSQDKFTQSAYKRLGRLKSGSLDSLNTLKPHDKPALEFMTTERNTDKLLGFHGTTKETSSTLSESLTSSHMGSRNNQLERRGFYTTPNFMVAQKYAEGLTTSQKGTPQVFGIYERRSTPLRLQDYYTSQDQIFVHNKILNYTEVIINESAFDSVSARAINLRRDGPLRGHEAPF